MTCLSDYFDENPLPSVDHNDEYNERLYVAYDVIYDVCDIIEQFEYFDVHDLMDTLSIHFDLEKSDLLEHYDSI